MKTVQTYLKETDRTRLLDAIAYNEIQDTLLLLEMSDRTVAQIQINTELMEKMVKAMYEAVLAF